jgi:hypothetical protein
MRSIQSIFCRAGKGLSQAAALTVLAASGIVLASPGTAHAALAECGNGSYTIAQLTSGFSCFIGDKSYSEFAFNNLPAGNFSFTQDALNGDHTFSGAGLNYTGPAFTYEYKVSLYNPPVGQEFLKFNTSFAGSSTITSSYQKVLEAFAADGTTLLGKVTAQNQLFGSNNVVISDGPDSFTPGEVGPIIFRNTVTRLADSSRMDTITDSITQKIPETPPSEVPGPLPRLGAGAAFGFSRQLRQRVKLAA